MTEEDAEVVDPAEATARARAALRYFRQTKPGKRSSALSSLWLALTGLERDRRAWQFLDNHRGMAVRTYSALPGALRTIAVQALIEAIEREPDPACRASMVTLRRHCDDLEALAVNARMGEKQVKPGRLERRRAWMREYSARKRREAKQRQHEERL